MVNNKKFILLLLKIVAIAACLIFFAEHYFFEIAPLSISPIYILAFLSLIALNWQTKEFKKKDYFKPTHIPLVILPLFLVVHLRAGIYWALNTFPLADANTVLLTLQEPFDDFAYSMIRQYLSTTIPQAAAALTTQLHLTTADPRIIPLRAIVRPLQRVGLLRLQVVPPTQIHQAALPTVHPQAADPHTVVHPAHLAAAHPVPPTAVADILSEEDRLKM